MESKGDSDDEIAELRIQALLTKRLNEAEVSPSRQVKSPVTSYQNQYTDDGKNRQQVSF